MEETQSINWLRWLVYLLGGVPIFVWLFTVRDRTLRVVGVLAMAFFVQDAMAGRRYFWAFSFGPAIGAAYVGLLAMTVQRQRLPQLGAYGAIWGGMLFCAVLGVVQGSAGGLLAINMKYFQLGYLDGFIFFLFGLVALQTHAEFRKFWEWFIPFCLLMALLHFFSIATGYRFRGSSTEGVSYGGVLDNANTLGSFYAMAIPAVLSLAVSGRLERHWRLLSYAALALMTGSLILTGCRGGMLFAILVSAMALASSRLGPTRVITASLAAAVTMAIGYAVMTFVVGDAWRAVLLDLEEQGFHTDRWTTFAGFMRIALDNPFGVGLSPENVRGIVSQYDVRVFSSHNIYIDMAVQNGIPGMLIFVWLGVRLILSNRQAMRLTSDPIAREGLFCAYLALLGFFGVGIFQPIYTASVGAKMNNLFWLLAGLNVGAVNRVLSERRVAADRELEANRQMPLATRPGRA
jgi:O-antigen ligase